MAAPEESPATPQCALGPSSEPGTTVLVIGGPIARAGILPLCERARLLLEGTTGDVIVCDVGALDEPDAVTIDALARLQLTARRLGRRIRLRHACAALRELLALAGLGDVVPPCVDLPLEPRGQAEQREQPGGVEEEGDPGDPVAR